MPFAAPQYASPIIPTQAAGASHTARTLQSSLSSLQWLRSIQDAPTVPEKIRPTPVAEATHPMRPAEGRATPSGLSSEVSAMLESCPSVPDIDEQTQRLQGGAAQPTTISAHGMPTIPLCPPSATPSPASEAGSEGSSPCMPLGEFSAGKVSPTSSCSSASASPLTAVTAAATASTATTTTTPNSTPLTAPANNSSSASGTKSKGNPQKGPPAITIKISLSGGESSPDSSPPPAAKEAGPAVNNGCTQETRAHHAADASTRPPYSYTALIYMAMKATDKARVQLGEIYGNVMDQWAYYRARPAESGWKNSIRHNLTVSKCFSKVARTDGDTGKGGYWQINEDLAQAEIILQPRETMPKHVNRNGSKPNKSKSKKAKGGAVGGASGASGATGKKGASSSKSSKSHKSTKSHKKAVSMPTLGHALKSITQAPRAHTHKRSGHADGDISSNSRKRPKYENCGLDLAEPEHLHTGFGRRSASPLENESYQSSMYALSFPFGGELEHAMNCMSEAADGIGLVPDNNTVIIGGGDDSAAFNDMLDSTLLGSSFSGMLDTAKGLSPNSSFSAFARQVVQ